MVWETRLWVGTEVISVILTAIVVNCFLDVHCSGFVVIATGLVVLNTRLVQRAGPVVSSAMQLDHTSQVHCPRIVAKNAEIAVLYHPRPLRCVGPVWWTPAASFAMMSNYIPHVHRYHRLASISLAAYSIFVHCAGLSANNVMQSNHIPHVRHYYPRLA